MPVKIWMRFRITGKKTFIVSKGTRISDYVFVTKTRLSSSKSIINLSGLFSGPSGENKNIIELTPM